MQMSNKLASFGKRVFLGMTLFLDDWNFANLFLYMPRSWHHVLKHCSSYLRFTLLEYLQQILCFASFGWGPLLGSRWCSLLVVISPISMNDNATAAFKKKYLQQEFWLHPDVMGKLVAPDDACKCVIEMWRIGEFRNRACWRHKLSWPVRFTTLTHRRARLPGATSKWHRKQAKCGIWASHRLTASYRFL
jgi:hypothetical protein